MLSKVFKLSSLLMASLFALSASFQFNDPDWYFWLPLYATACVVNLVHGCAPFAYQTIHQVAKFSLGLGFFLFIKVVIEDQLLGTAAFLSLDMRERSVREKFGSGLVISCMFLQLMAITPFPIKENKVKVAICIQYGMAMLVGMSYGLSLVFYLFHERDMKL